VPQRNPKTGKQLSGGAKRAAAKRRADTYKAAAAATAAQPAHTPPAAGDFAELEPPPLGRPAEAIAWCNDVLLIALYQVLRDPALGNLERWSWIQKFGTALGLIRDKASEQAAIKKALEAQHADRLAQGTVSASGRTKKAVPRPSS
jgi:hypothetical protein